MGTQIDGLAQVPRATKSKQYIIMGTAPAWTTGQRKSRHSNTPARGKSPTISIVQDISSRGHPTELECPGVYDAASDLGEQGKYLKM